MKKLFIGVMLIASPALAGLVSHTDYTPNTTISASGQNANENAIVNEINGNLDSSNIATNGVANGNIAPAAVTIDKLSTPIQSSITAMGILTATQTWSGYNTFTSSVVINAGGGEMLHIEGGGDIVIEPAVNGAHTNMHNDFGTLVVTTPLEAPNLAKLIVSSVAVNAGTMAFNGLNNWSCSSYSVEISSLTPQTDNQPLFTRIDVGGGYLAGTSNSFVINYNTVAGGYGVNGADNGDHIAVTSADLLPNTRPSSLTATYYNRGGEKVVTFQGGGVGHSTRLITWVGTGLVQSAPAVIQGIEFFMSSGQIASGEFRIYCNPV